MSETINTRAGRTDNPYVGPRAFRMNEELYGREKEESALFNLLMAERIVLLYSPSGSGKTSLIQAKLVPHLMTNRFRVLGPMRVGLKLVTAADVTQSQANVNQYLASAVQSLEAQLPIEEQLGPTELAGLDLAGYLRRRGLLGQGAGRLAFIFDQFEEILTVNPNDRDGKRAFFEHIGELLREPDEGQPIWALFSMREEYIAALEQYLRPIPTRLGNTLRIDRLDVDNAQLAIQKPAESKNIPFTQDALKQLVTDLCQERVQLPDGKVETQTGAYIEPVQLQVVCTQLWKKLPGSTTKISTAELSVLGKDISSALGDYYDECVKSIAAKEKVSERDLRRWIERKLITEQGIRSQALISVQDSGLGKAISALVDVYLIRRETPRNATWYELSHDRLVEPVRQANKAWFRQNETLFQHQAALWNKEGESNKNLLLSGEALEEAERYADARKGKLEDYEERFLGASRRARAYAEKEKLQIAKERRQAHLIRIWSYVATGFAFIALVACVVAVTYMIHFKEQEQKAIKSAQRTESLLNEKVALLKEMNDALDAKKIAINKLKISLDNETKAKLAANNAIEEKTKLLEEKDYLLSVAIKATKKANENARIAHARQLAAQAITIATEQPDLALLLSLEAIRIDNSPESRSSLFMALGRSTPQLSQYLRGHDREVWRLASNPAGNRLASADETGTIILWNIETQMPCGPPLTGHKGPIHSLSFNPKGNLLATIDDTGILRLWDVETARFLNDLKPDTGAFMRVAFSPDGRLLAAGKTDGSIPLYDISTFSSGKFVKRPVMELAGTGEATYALVFSGDSSILASAHDKNFILWNTATGKRLCPPQKGHTDLIYVLAFSADGKTLATGSEDMKVILWDVADPRQPNLRHQPLTRHTDAVTGVAFSPDDRVLYSASGDRSVRMWDTATGQQVGRALTGQARSVLSLAIGDDGNTLATGGMDGSIILWNIYTQQRLGFPLYGIFVPIRGIAFSPDGSKLASGGQDNRIILWDAARQQQKGAPLVPTSPQGETNRNEWITSLIFHPHQELLYAGSTDRSIRVWDTKLHKENGSPMMMNNGVISLALSHDSRFLAAGDDEKNIIIWDLETREKKHPPLTKHTNAVWSLAFDKNDTILASGSDDMSIRLWDVKSGKSKGEPLKGCSGRVSSMAFSPRNGFLYTTCADEILRWDITRSSSEHRRLYKSKDGSKIFQLDFSPDGSVLAVGSGSTVIFIDPETGKALFEPAAGIRSPIWSVAFDPQGKTVATGTSNGHVTLWNPRTGKRFGRFMLGHHRDVYQMALSSDGTMLAVSSNDNKIEIVQPKGGNNPIKPSELHSGERVTALIFNSLPSASRQLFTASTAEKGRILSWDLGTKQPTISSPIARETGYLHSLAISPNGATLAAGSDQGGITLWDLSTTPPVKRPLRGHGKDADGTNKPVYSLAFNENGRLLASGSISEFIIWDVVTGDQLAIRAEEGAVKDYLRGLQFSPKGAVLAVPNKRGDIVLWDVRDPRDIRERHRLRGHSGTVSSLSFSSDGETLASGSRDHSVRLWDTDSGLPLSLDVMRHNDIVNSVVFSSDNKLYSGGNDGLIMQWDVDIERLKLNAIRTASRNLTIQEWKKYLPKQKYTKTQPKPLLLEADLLSLKGERKDAKELYHKIVEITRTSNDAPLLNFVCWNGSVNRYSDIVMASCDRAVSKASFDQINDYRDSRGVARATANPPRIKEAIEDFQAFVDWTEKNPKYTSTRNLRQQWIRELQAGRNPFNEERLRQLRNETIQ